MPDILHRVGIGVKPDRVYAALTTLDGLRHWWIVETKGEPKVGGTIDFGFCHMQVVESKPNELVHWRCTSGPPEWVGTEVIYRLYEKDGQTFVVFTHKGWKEAVEFMHHCSTKWATFLLSMRDLLEGHEAHPYPHDVKLYVGD